MSTSKFVQDALELENELQDACLEKILKWEMSVFARCTVSTAIRHEPEIPCSQHANEQFVFRLPSVLKSLCSSQK